MASFLVLTLLLLVTTVHPLFSAPLSCIIYPELINCPSQQKQCCIENYKLTPCTCVESFDSFDLTKDENGEPVEYHINIDLPRQELIDGWFEFAKVCFPYFKHFDDIEPRTRNQITTLLNRDLPGGGMSNVIDVCPRIRRKIKVTTTIDVGLV